MLRTILLTLLLIFTLIVPDVATAQDTVVTKAYIQSLEERVQRLENNTGTTDITKERLDLINDKIENLQTESQISSAGVANEIAASSNFLTIWSVVFAIAGIALAAFVNTQQNKSAKNLEENKDILAESKMILGLQEKAKNEVLEIQTAIKESIDEVYHRLLLKEVDYLIKLLEREPGDIDNVGSKLATVTLLEEHYYRLRKVVDKSDVDDNRFLKSIVGLMIYKFPALWLKDYFIKERFVLDYDIYLDSLFDFEQMALLKALSNHLKSSGHNDQDLTVGASFLLYHCGYSYKSPSNSDSKVKVEEWFRDFYNDLEYKSLRFSYLERALELYDEYFDNSSAPNKPIPNGASQLEMVQNILKIYGNNLLLEYGDDATNTPEQQKRLERIREVLS